MPEQDRQPRPGLGEDPGSDVAYRPVSAIAIVALILGLASPLALLSLDLLVVPAAAAGCCVLALAHRLRRNPAMLGRKAAMAGLALAVLSASAGVTNALAWNWLLDREAEAAGRQWFALLAANQPQKAYQLTLAPALRQALDDDQKLWATYRNDPDLRRELHQYLRNPLVRTLLALGPKAEVRYWHCPDRSTFNGCELWHPIFAVTYDDAGEKKTFFVLLTMLRIPGDDDKAEWQIHQAEGGVRPEGFGEGS